MKYHHLDSGRWRKLFRYDRHSNQYRVMSSKKIPPKLKEIDPHKLHWQSDCGMEMTRVCILDGNRIFQLLRQNDFIYARKMEVDAWKNTVFNVQRGGSTPYQIARAFSSKSINKNTNEKVLLLGFREYLKKRGIKVWEKYDDKKARKTNLENQLKSYRKYIEKMWKETNVVVNKKELKYWYKKIGRIVE